jgi:acyl transferase domain-containing protein
VAPAIEMLSTLTAAPLVAAPDVGYWVQQMVRPVRFRDAIRRLVADGRRTFVEVGPHPVLRSSIVATLRDAGVAGAAVASTRRDGDEAADVRAGLARLYELGFAVDWRAAQRGGRRVDLPRYRWQRERLWLDGGPVPAAMGDAAPAAGSQAGGSITHGEGDRIAAVLAEVLGRSAVPLEQSLAELGFDSLMAAELRVRIEAETGCRVAMLTLLRAPTVGALLTAVAAAVSAPAG